MAPRAHRDERGTAAVEFALVLPLLLVIALALVQVGLLVRDRLLVEVGGACRGARRRPPGRSWRRSRDAAAAAAPALDPGSARRSRVQRAGVAGGSRHGDGRLHRRRPGAARRLVVRDRRDDAGVRDRPSGVRVRSERGSITVVAAAVIAIIVVATMGVADVGKALVARAHAQQAADAAALAAAQELALPTGSEPCRGCRRPWRRATAPRSRRVPAPPARRRRWSMCASRSARCSCSRGSLGHGARPGGRRPARRSRRRHGSVTVGLLQIRAPAGRARTGGR